MDLQCWDYHTQFYAIPGIEPRFCLKLPTAHFDHFPTVSLLPEGDDGIELYLFYFVPVYSQPRGSIFLPM